MTTTMLRRVPVALVVVLAAAALAALLLQRHEPESDAPPAPDYRTTDLGGREVDLAGLRGQPVLLSFWSTTCVTCVEEIPTLVQLYERHRSDGFVLLAIAMGYDHPGRIRVLAERLELPYTLIHDTSDIAAETFGPIRGTPTTLLVSPEGRIVYRELGHPDFDRIERTLQHWRS